MSCSLIASSLPSWRSSQLQRLLTEHSLKVSGNHSAGSPQNANGPRELCWAGNMSPFAPSSVERYSGRAAFRRYKWLQWSVLLKDQSKRFINNGVQTERCDITPPSVLVVGQTQVMQCTNSGSAALCRPQSGTPQYIQGAWVLDHTWSPTYLRGWEKHL